MSGSTNKRMTVAFEVLETPLEPLQEGQEIPDVKSELTELTADNFHHMMEQTDGMSLPHEFEWKMAIALFGMGKPIRLHYQYKLDSEDITVVERNHSGRARHTLPVADFGGLFLLHSLLGWTQSLQAMGEWLSW